MPKPSMKLPSKEAAPIPSVARQVARFMFGLAGAMLLLLLLLAVLAAQQGRPVGWGVVAGWILFFIAWPAGAGIRQWQRFRQACELEREHGVLTGKVIGFHHQEIGGLEATPTSDVYWIIFTVDGGIPIKQQVSLETYQRLAVGDTLEVEVSPHDCTLCRAKVL
jgi:hypothetical protein